MPSSAGRKRHYAHGIKLSHQLSFPHCVVQNRSSWSRLDFNFADFAIGMLMLHSSRPVTMMLNYWKEGMEVLRPQALSAFFVDLQCAVNKIQTALDKLGPELTLLDGKQPSLWSWTACLESNGLEWRKAATVRIIRLKEEAWIYHKMKVLKYKYWPQLKMIQPQNQKALLIAMRVSQNSYCNGDGPHSFKVWGNWPSTERIAKYRERCSKHKL